MYTCAYVPMVQWPMLYDLSADLSAVHARAEPCTSPDIQSAPERDGQRYTGVVGRITLQLTASFPMNREVATGEDQCGRHG